MIGIIARDFPTDHVTGVAEDRRRRGLRRLETVVVLIEDGAAGSQEHGGTEEETAENARQIAQAHENTSRGGVARHSARSQFDPAD